MKKRYVLIGIVVLAVVTSGWAWAMLRPVNAGNPAPISVKIEEGQSVGVIAETLQKNGLIRSPMALKIYARLKGAHTKLQAGRFSLNQSQSVGQIIDALQSGETSETSITIPEGYTVELIDELLAKKNLIKAGEFMDCAYTCDFSGLAFMPARNIAARSQGYGSKVEGYLFPETYFVDADQFSAETFIRRMIGTFEERVVIGHADAIKQSGKPLHEIITMASLIEEETRHEEERAIVAGILWKRLENTIGLGVDAAVRYVLRKPTAAITSADLDTDSPYNTRKYAGLPPGPIASPGESSIMAALNPEASEYWYYLHGTDGVIRYAKTNDEHNQNRARYLH